MLTKTYSTIVSEYIQQKQHVLVPTNKGRRDVYRQHRKVRYGEISVLVCVCCNIQSTGNHESISKKSVLVIQNPNKQHSQQSTTRTHTTLASLKHRLMVHDGLNTSISCGGRCADTIYNSARPKEGVAVPLARILLR